MIFLAIITGGLAAAWILFLSLGASVKEWNLGFGRVYGGITILPYQLAFGLSVRGGEFTAVRMYFGPIKGWISYTSTLGNE